MYQMFRSALHEGYKLCLDSKIQMRKMDSLHFKIKSGEFCKNKISLGEGKNFKRWKKNFTTLSLWFKAHFSILCPILFPPLLTQIRRNFFHPKEYIHLKEKKHYFLVVRMCIFEQNSVFRVQMHIFEIIGGFFKNLMLIKLFAKKSV